MVGKEGKILALPALDFEIDPVTYVLQKKALTLMR
jgi:hypothetical protein